MNKDTQTSGSNLWFDRSYLGETAVWCAGAYIVRKTPEIKRAIDSIVIPQPDGKLGFRFITGYENPCIPKECCSSDGNIPKFHRYYFFLFLF